MRVKLLLLVLLSFFLIPVGFAGISLPLVDEASLKLTFYSDAKQLSHTEPLVGTLEAVGREDEEISLPNLQERFRGFAVVEDFSAGRVVANGKACARWRFRLTPEASGPWDLRPFVFTVKNLRSGQIRTVLTQGASFPAPPPLPAASGGIEADLSPEWVAPGWKTFRAWLLPVVGLGVLIALIVPLLKRVRRRLQERTLSPEVRAQLELERLLAEGLVAQGLFKRFYYGLTGVVRRYFERGYGLRATRQTSQEFLAQLKAEPRIHPEERDALAEFLSLADMIKFAGIQVTALEAEAATRSVQQLLAQAAAHRQARVEDASSVRR